MEKEKDDSNLNIFWIIGIVVVIAIWVFSGSDNEQDSYKDRYKHFNNIVAEENCLTADETWNNIGENTCVEYFVSNPYKSRKGNIFLNQKKDYKNSFTTVIFNKSVDNFDEDPWEYYGNEKIRVNGLIKMYRGHPEIIINYPSEIEIIE